jgi:hypothetical protein
VRVLFFFGLLSPMFFFSGILPSVKATSVAAPKFTFAAAGDFGGIKPGLIGYAVAQKLNATKPDFTIALGDLGYNDQNPKYWCNNFTHLYTNPLVLVTGNHDTWNGGFNMYADGSTGTASDTLTSEVGNGYLDSSSGYVSSCGAPAGISWVGSSVTSNQLRCLPTLSSPSCYSREYYFDYPTLNPIMRFIFISAGICGTWFNGCPNSTYIGWTAPTPPATCTTPPPAGSEHYCWLKARIDEAKNQGMWVAVALHKECLTDDGNGCESTIAPFNLALNETVGQSMGVDLWLDGHDHTYQRSIQLSGPCHVVNDTYTPCNPVDFGDGKKTPYVKGRGTVVSIIGTGGAAEDPLCPYSPTHNCPNQQFFSKLCGSEGPISGVNQTTGCPSGGDHGFTYFNVTTNQINATYVSATGSFTDHYFIQVPNPPGDFSASSSFMSRTTRRGPGGGPNSASVLIDLNSFGLFSGNVSLNANVSSVFFKSFSPASVQLTAGNTGSSNLTITTLPGTACGNSTSPKVYGITVTATSRSISHQTTFFLTVYANGDVNLDGKVNIFDLTSVGGSFGAMTGDANYNPAADLNSDGAITILDLVIVGGNFGANCW